MALTKSRPKYNNSNVRSIVIGCCFLASTLRLHNAGVSLSLTEPADLSGVPRDAPHAASRAAPLPRTTLVHFDPYFMGGFRNQHMRFVAFVSYAATRNISQILLPSLRWGDHYNKSNAVPHDFLFDVDYWNAKAEGAGLPLLVQYDPGVLEGIISTNATTPAVVPCFNVTSGLYSGVKEAFLRNPAINLRKTNTWELLGQGARYAHCRRTWGTDGENDPARIAEAARRDNATHGAFRFTHLLPHGGMGGGAGHLWYEHEALQHQRRHESEPAIIDGKVVGVYPEHAPVERAVFELLRPSARLRRATARALQTSTRNANPPPRLLALHPRVEQEMMYHRCSSLMEPNLTKVFHLLQTFPAFREGNNSGAYRFDLVFLVGSTQEIEKSSPRTDRIGMIMNQNKDAFRRAREHGLFGSVRGNGSRTAIPTFQSATEIAAKIQFPRMPAVAGAGPRGDDRGTPGRHTTDTPGKTAAELGVQELVASILHFWIAAQAEIFVGVKGSSYSTDVFSVRYYRHKWDGGGENYVVGPQGLARLYGPAAPHTC